VSGDGDERTPPPALLIERTPLPVLVSCPACGEDVTVVVAVEEARVQRGLYGRGFLRVAFESFHADHDCAP
jgi:hypothetical protein